MEAGTTVGARFVIEKLVGSGGMGSVFAAIDQHDGARVALKVLHDEGSTNAQRFQDEGRVLEEVGHGSIVRYVDQGLTPEGAPYLAMEWLEGEDLEHRLARAPLSLAEICSIGIAAAAGLAAAHGRGVVHRDIKPSHLFLVEGDTARVKLIDFGIARRVEAPSGLTGIGKAIGTLGYMAPEQARADERMDGRVDLFALGCVLFECLTGKRAFSGGHPLAVLTKILLEDPPRVRELVPALPEALDALVASMLAKEPSERPSSALLVLDALEAIREPLVAGESFRPTALPVEPKPAPVLTRRERALVSIVLVQEVNRASIDALGATVAPVDDSLLLEILRAKLEPNGARVESLADGSIVAVLRGSGSARDQADRAALSALTLARTLVGRGVVLSTGRAELGGRVPVGEVIDDAVEALRSVQTGASFGVAHPIVDAVTVGLLSPRFEVETRDGRSFLVGEHAPEDWVRGLLGRPTPCVGRDAELRAMEAAYQRCIAGHHPEAISVIGAPGVGKSRLRFEIGRRLIDRTQWPSVFSAGGDPTTRASPLALVAQILRHAFRIREADSAARAHRLLRDRIARLVPAAEVDRIAAFLAEALGTPMHETLDPFVLAARRDGRLMGDHIRRAWIEWLDAESRVRPVVLSLEDLHVCDRPSSDLINAAMTSLPSSTILLIGFARPEGADRLAELLGSVPTTAIELADLSPAASAQLVKAALGDDVNAEVLARIVGRAAGNAFYLEELIRASAERSQDEVPPTVLAMAQSRVLTLDAEARRVLRAASVFGRVFWPGGVATLVGSHDLGRSLSDWIDRLVEREVLVRHNVSRFEGEDELAFRHDLLAEAAYSMLVEDDRSLGHSLAAGWLERAGETDGRVLAAHYDRSNDRSRAVHFYLAAARQALGRNDPTSALECVERGVDCGASGSALGKLCGVAADAHFWRGDLSEAERVATSALGLLPLDSSEGYAAMGVEVSAATTLGHHHAIYDRVEHATSSRPDGVEERVAAIAAAARMASHLATAGLHPLCDRLLAWMDELMKTAPPLDETTMGLTVLARGLRAAATGDLSAFKVASEVAAGSFARAGDLRRASSARANVSFASAELGLYEAAEEALLGAMDDSARNGASHMSAYMSQNLGALLARRGDLGRARQLELEVIEMARSQDDKLLEVGARIYLARILLAMGDHEGARRESSQAAASTTHLPARRAMALATLAAALPRSDIHRALATAAEAVDIVEELGGVDELEAFIRLVHAELSKAAGVPGASAAIRRAGARLVERAALIVDAGMRQSFLTRVEENARTMTLVSELESAAAT